MRIKQKRLSTIIPGSYNEERCHQYAVAFLKKNYPQFLDEFEKFWKKKKIETEISYSLGNLIFFTFPDSFTDDISFKNIDWERVDEAWMNFCSKYIGETE